MLERLDPNQIEDETSRQQVIYLINLLEKCLSQIQELKAEVAALKDHIKRLNGEQPRLFVLVLALVLILIPFHPRLTSNHSTILVLPKLQKVKAGKRLGW